MSQFTKTTCLEETSNDLDTRSIFDEMHGRKHSGALPVHVDVTQYNRAGIASKAKLQLSEKASILRSFKILPLEENSRRKRPTRTPSRSTEYSVKG
jgi:hypothetical protein